MTKTVEVVTSVERRPRWSRAEKERIVAASLEPGAVASEVARAAGIHASQLFRWRQQLCKRTQVPATFNPVVNRRANLALTQFWCSWFIRRRSIWPEEDRYCRGRTSGAARA
jgi:transposase